MRPGHFLEPVLSSTDRWGLTVLGSDLPLATDATLAGTSAARRRGLAGRPAMSPGEALVIAPSQGIHTFGMRFPIDVVAVDRHGVVVGISALVAPRRVRFAWRAFAMIELPPGTAAQVRVQAGDRVVAHLDPNAAR